MHTHRLIPASVLALVVGLLSGCASDGPGSTTSAAEAKRYSAIRREIKRNLHFNLHCFCKAADPDTVTAVRSRVTEADIPILIRLLDDSYLQVGYGARGVLVRIGTAAVPALEAAQRSRPAPAPNPVLDTLDQIAIQERVRRQSHPDDARKPE